VDGSNVLTRNPPTDEPSADLPDEGPITAGEMLVLIEAWAQQEGIKTLRDVIFHLGALALERDRRGKS
jgi:hypothetical protein